MCPNNFILVPGNPIYKTQDFCVMKYDAKCSNRDPKCVTNEGVYKNDKPGCACQGDFQVVSTPNGAPITYISAEGNNGINAKNYCQKQGWHLITNAEWMSISRNIEQVDTNWCNKDGTGCGNSPGTKDKILANGHNDSKPSKALESGNDNEPCYETSANGICGQTGSQKRTWQLSSGEVIWDLAGNVWQWIDMTIPRKDQPQAIINGHIDYRWEWSEFAGSKNQSVISSNGSLKDEDYRPSNPNWNSDQRVGMVFHFDQENDTDTTLYGVIRGGNWRHGKNSGIFTIHFQPVPDKTGIDDVGFRCVTSITN